MPGYGVVLAAGHGTRMGPMTASLPKALLPFENIPLLVYNLFLLDRAGVDTVTVNVHAHPELMDRFIAKVNASRRVILRAVHEPLLAGTAGGLRDILRAYPATGSILVTNCDLIALPDNPDFRLAWSAPPPGSQHLWLRPSLAGETRLRRAPDGRLLFDATGDRSFAGVAVYRDLAPELPEETPSELRPVFEKLSSANRLAGTDFPGRLLSVGTLEEWHAARAALQNEELAPIWTRYKTAVDRFYRELGQP